MPTDPSGGNAVPDEIHLNLTGIQGPALPDRLESLIDLARRHSDSKVLTAVRAASQHPGRVTRAHLMDMGLQTLPAWLTSFPRLIELDISGNAFQAFPRELRQLRTLNTLNMAGNRIRAVPLWIALLSRLKHLDLGGNSISEVPPQIGDLQQLEYLDLSANELQRVPTALSRLVRLVHLDLGANRLSGVPNLLAWQRLQYLYLDGNLFKTIPPPILALPALQELDLRNNDIESVPTELEHLRQLQELDLRNNRITSLPYTLANLPRLNRLDTRGNPLNEPLPALVVRGLETTVAYLKSLKDAVGTFEAKLMLVGEGAVGKSSLLAALRGEPFIQDRPTTHGIDLSALPLDSPSLGRPITFRTWDFGGQEVYRITHQFFFSRRSLYLLVWKPREGREENAVEDWIRRLRLRVGVNVRIIVVATHGEDRIPELDTQMLAERYGDSFAGAVVVDSRSGMGLAELKELMVREAAQLPQMGQPVSRRWLAVRSELSKLHTRFYIGYADYSGICALHGVQGEERKALATLLSDLGYLLYFPEDEGLKDVLVLNPDWLTKAVGYVLEDRTVRDANGDLIHARLHEIWNNPRRDYQYDRALYPYFLRLMEKFDVSYRYADGRSSLVAQLVPYERPPFEFPGGKGRVRRHVVCEFSEEPPGIIAWLTVRTRRFARPERLHWRRGVVLAYPPFDSDAVVEMVGRTTLRMTVEAPSPTFLFVLLQDSVVQLIADRWPGLTYELSIMCPGASSDEASCQGTFSYGDIRRFRSLGRSSMECHKCARSFMLDQLVFGFEVRGQQLQEIVDSLSPVLSDIQDSVRDLTGTLGRVEVLAGEAARAAVVIRQIRRTLETEVSDCPRLFSIVPARKGSDLEEVTRVMSSAKGTISPAMTGGTLDSLKRSVASVWEREYELRLWCEFDGEQHLAPDAVYRFRQSREWFVRTAPYLRVMSKIGSFLPLAGSVVGLEGKLASQEKVERQWEIVSESIAVADEIAAVAGSISGETAILSVAAAESAIADGAGLRAFRELLFNLDRSRRFGGLRRWMQPTGEYVWICAEHYARVERGLPSLD